MILKLDHVAFATDSPTADISLFTSLGWTVRFAETDIANPGIKQGLMRHFCPRQGVTLLDHPHGPSVELLDHGPTVGVGPLQLVLTGVPTAMREPTGTTAEIAGEHLTEALLDGRIPVWLKTGDSPGSAGVVALTRAAEPAAEFFGSLGFRSDEADRRRLTFSSPIDRTAFSLYLLESPSASGWHLDDDGANCVALVTSALPTELARLSSAGYCVSESAELVLAGREVTVAFVTGPGGELVELIGVARPRDVGN